MFRKLIVAGMVSLPTIANCYAAGKPIGNWYVSIDKDPFSTKKKTIALTTSKEQGALVIRCFPDEGLSVLVGVSSDKKYEPGAALTFKYRADEGPIVDDKATAFGTAAGLLPNGRQVLQDALKANTIFIRIETPEDTLVDLSFYPRGATKALSQILTDCPVESDPKVIAPEKQ